MTNPIFKDEILNACVLHIPHASTIIPNASGFVKGEIVEHNLKLLTDFATDRIFDVDGITQLVLAFVVSFLILSPTFNLKNGYTRAKYYLATAKS